MPRPTPVRILYMIVGILIGAAILFAYVNVFGAPRVLSLGRPASESTPSAAAFSGSKLVKTVAINQQASKSNIHVRLNSLEHYSDGISITYSILSSETVAVPPVLQPDAFQLTDDKGRQY